MNHSLYDVLGAQRTASFDELRACFKKQALCVHPDKGGSKDAFQKVLAAFEQLSNPDLRASYDQSLACGKGLASSRLGKRSARRSNQWESDGGATKRAKEEQRYHPQDSSATPAEKAESKKGSTASCANSDSKSQTSDIKFKTGEARILGKLQRLLAKVTREERQHIASNVLPQNLRIALTSWIATPASETSSRVTATSRSGQGGPVDDSCDDDSDDNEADASDNLQLEDAALLAPMLCDGRPDSESDEEPGDGGPNTSQDGLQGNGLSRVRGIRCSNCNGKLYYRAEMTVGFLKLACRSTLDLDNAVDQLSILAALKVQILSGQRRFSLTFAHDFPDKLKSALSKISHEAGDEAFNELGLSFSLHLSSKYWIGRRSLYTPRTTCLETCLKLWRQFAELQMELAQDCTNGTRSITHSLLTRLSPEQLEAHWQRFKHTFIMSWSCVPESSATLARCTDARGSNREKIGARLDAMAQANFGHRERMMELWNRTQMRKAEQQQRSQRRFSPIDRAKLLAEAWQQLCDRRTRKQLAAKARQKAEEERCKERDVKLALRKSREEREKRWKQMNRPDLTMEDLLGGWPGGT